MSRKLEKLEFINLLREVSIKLDDKSIHHEIPFVHRDKKIYDFIKILVPGNIDATILEDIFKSNQYQLINKYIDFYYKDFRFIFIRTPDDEFFQYFFYYSWDILTTLMNVILNKMGLNLIPSGLYYIGCKNPFYVSNNIKLILEYLDLDFQHYIQGFSQKPSVLELKTEKGEIIKVSGDKIIGKGFNSLFDEISYITTSQYFNVQVFKEYQLDSNDFFYFEKEPQYKYALNLFENFDNINFEGYDYNRNLDSYLLNIDIMFPGSDFLEKVTKSKFEK